MPAPSNKLVVAASTLPGSLTSRGLRVETRFKHSDQAVHNVSALLSQPLLLFPQHLNNNFNVRCSRLR